MAEPLHLRLPRNHDRQAGGSGGSVSRREPASAKKGVEGAKKGVV